MIKVPEDPKITIHSTDELDERISFKELEKMIEDMTEKGYESVRLARWDEV